MFDSEVKEVSNEVLAIQQLLNMLREQRNITAYKLYHNIDSVNSLIIRHHSLQKKFGLCFQPFNHDKTVTRCRQGFEEAQAKLLQDIILKERKNSIQKSRVLFVLRTSTAILPDVGLYCGKIKCLELALQIDQQFIHCMVRFHTSVIGAPSARMSADDRDVLLRYFANELYPSLVTKQHVARKSGLSLAKINNWLRIQRYRQKKALANSC